MTTSQIIIAIFSSSVLSAILTSAVNFYLTSVNYKNEYYKKLLDKRLSAYEDIYSFLNKLKLHIHDTDESYITPYLLTQGTKELEILIIGILLPIKNSIWVSNDLAEEMSKLNVLLHNLLNKAQSYPDPDKALAIIGYEQMEEIRTLRKSIEWMMRRDFEKLHNIQNFLSERS